MRNPLHTNETHPLTLLFPGYGLATTVWPPLHHTHYVRVGASLVAESTEHTTQHHQRTHHAQRAGCQGTVPAQRRALRPLRPPHTPYAWCTGGLRMVWAPVLTHASTPRCMHIRRGEHPGHQPGAWRHPTRRACITVFTLVNSEPNVLRTALVLCAVGLTPLNSERLYGWCYGAWCTVPWAWDVRLRCAFGAVAMALATLPGVLRWALCSRRANGVSEATRYGVGACACAHK